MPPEHYTTNWNVSMKMVAHEYVNYSPSSLVQLANNMYELIINQMKEAEKVIYGMSEFRFRTKYKHL